MATPLGSRAFTIPTPCEQQSVAESFESFLKREVPDRSAFYLRELQSLEANRVHYGRGKIKFSTPGRYFRIKVRVPVRLNNDNRWTWEFALSQALHAVKAGEVIASYEEAKITSDQLGQKLHNLDQLYLDHLRKVNPNIESFLGSSVQPNNTAHRIILSLNSWLLYFHPFRYRMNFRHELTSPPTDAGVIALRAFGTQLVRNSRNFSYLLAIVLSIGPMTEVDWTYLGRNLWPSQASPESVEMVDNVQRTLINRGSEIAESVHNRLTEEYRVKREAVTSKLAEAEKRDAGPQELAEIRQELRDLDDVIRFVFHGN